MTEARNADLFEVLAFFMADHAVVENGKVYVNGGFINRIYHPVYPAPVSIAVVAQLKVSPEAFLQDHMFAVEMEDAAGDKLDLKIEGVLRVAASHDSKPGEPMLVPLAVPLTGISLERAGDYSFVLSVDENEVARYEIRAAQVGIIAQPLPQSPPGDSGGPQEE